jgi:cytochrome c-type biogenesis protein CcmF
MVTGYATVFKGGQQIATAYPAKWAFHKHENEPPTTEVWIRRAFAEDLYIVLAAYDAGSQAVTLQIFVNPLVNWIWLGFGLMAFGTGIALLPERSLSFALSKLPASDAAVTTAMLLLMLLLSGAPLFAQHETTLEEQLAPIKPRNAVEQSLYNRFVCLCGSCGKEPIGTCVCSYAAGIRREIATQVDLGKSEDEIVQHFISEMGGQQLLGAPLNHGIGRFSWLFPYMVGAGSMIVVGFAAIRWSRRGDRNPGDANEHPDAAMSERLDDELRNLD